MPTLPESTDALLRQLSAVFGDWTQGGILAPLAQAARQWLPGWRGYGFEYDDKRWTLVMYFSGLPPIPANILVQTLQIPLLPDIGYRLVDSGEIVPLAAQPLLSISAGESDSSVANCTGSLGGIVLFNGQPCLLSCNHVIYFDGQVLDPVSKQAPIIHPARSLGGSTTIATVLKNNLFNLRPGSANPGDWALASLSATASTEAWWPPQFPAGLKLTKPEPEKARDALGKKVHKVGATTGHTSGTVCTIAHAFSTGFDGIPGGPYRFKEQLRVRSSNNSPFALPGDSGALVITEDGSAVGLVCAKDDKEAIITPLEPLFQGRDIKFLLPE
jgi:hypothetical protein